MQGSRLLTVMAIAAVAGTTPCAARADDNIIVVGHVFASDGKQPLADATVAVYDDKNQVIDHARTDADGKYTLKVPRSDFHFPSHHSGGNFMGGLLKGAVKVVGAAASVAVPLAGMANPIAGAGASLAEGALSGLGGGGVRRLPGGKMGAGMMDQARARALVSQMQARGMAVPPQLLAIANGSAEGAETLAANASGALPVRVTLQGHADAVSVTQIYCLQEQIDREDGKKTRTVTAWVDPVQLAETGDQASAVVPHRFFKLQQAQAEPSIAEYGQTVKMSVKMATPGEPNVPIIVIAHNVKTGKDYELTPAGDDLYSAEIMVDKEFVKNTQTLCILAYAQDPEKPGRNKKSEDALRGGGLWDATKPYLFDPGICRSRNRAEVVLTVVEAHR
jgi:hypothetical protein